jgi:hypothetical protein
MLPTSRYQDERARLFGDLVMVLFLCAQVLDGAFTYIGVRAFGPSIEANPILAWLIAAVGPGAALTSAKLTAIAFGAFLHLSCVHRVVATLTGFYFVMAIGPWTHVLFFLR